MLIPKWKIPVAISFNSKPRFLETNDTRGQLVKRQLIFDWDYHVKDITLKYKDEVEAELPLFLVKINRCYHQLLQEIGTCDLWSKVPKELLKTKERYQ